MPTDSMVYHIRDEALFRIFISGLGREILTEPLRRDEDLRNAHFRGYRISQTIPSKDALTKAYYKELNEKRNHLLLNYLCSNWIGLHPALATQALHVLGVTAELGSINEWLPKVHKILQCEGHLEAAKKLIRALAMSFSQNEVLIFLSILSVEYEAQDELKAFVEENISLIQNDPYALREHLQNQLSQQASQLTDFDKTMQELREHDIALQEQSVRDERDVQTELGSLQNTVTEVKADLNKAEGRFNKAEAEFKSARDAVGEVQERHTALLGREKKLQARIGQLKEEFTQSRKLNSEALNHVTQKREKLRDEHKKLQEQLQAVEDRIRQHSSAEEPTPIDESERSRVTGGHGPPLTPQEWLARTQEQVDDNISFSSCSTLELLRLNTSDTLSGAADGPEPPNDVFVDPLPWRNYYAHRCLRVEPRWDRRTLAHYSWTRTLIPSNEDSEVLADFVISGIYHAERTSDKQLIDNLLGRLLEICSGVRVWDRRDPQYPHRLTNSIEQIGQKDKLLFFGATQGKLATASPAALHRLYELLTVRAKLIAKRAVVAQLPKLNLDDKDPTHELLDVVCTTIGSSVEPLVRKLRVWHRHNSIDTIAEEREALLVATAKISPLFSKESRSRIDFFRSLLGRQLTQAIARGTPDGYATLAQACASYGEAELAAPEWISSRYLFPLVLQIARAGLNADLEARKTLRATLSAELEKTQYPIGGPGRDITIGIRVQNSGTADAENVTLSVFAAPASATLVTLKDAEGRIGKVSTRGEPPRHLVTLATLAPVPVVDLEYMLVWNDPSAHQRSEIGNLKVLAQRDIDWESVKGNPYSLRSITDPSRLYDRHKDLQMLRMGILGLQSFYLTGQKRVGKSSVARVLYNEFSSDRDIVPVYVTLGELNASSAATMMYSLQKAIAENVPHAVRTVVIESLPSEGEFANQLGAAARTFLKALEQYSPNLKMLCLVDDFDELTESLYKKAESVPLFLFLRTLIDSGNFSFIFVGSERLPEIQRHQGERLNQVKTVNLDYLSELSRLVREPAAPHLEFSDEAVDRVRFHSTGNPYYANQICIRVYEDMVTRRDHYVGTVDVERNISTICEEEGVSTFQHFWKDGIFEGGVDVERLQYINAQLLLELARLEGPERKSVSQEAILGTSTLTKHEPGEVNYRLRNLIERRVVELQNDELRLRVPLLSRWLRTGGAAAVHASFGERAFEMSSTPVRTGVPPREIVELSTDLIYQGARVNEIQIRAWLEQFGGGQEQSVVFRLLRHLKQKGYFDDQRIHLGMRKLHSLIVGEYSGSGWTEHIRRRKTTNMFVTSIDREGKSGAALLYSYRNANDIPTGLTGTMERAVEFLKKTERGAVLVLLDDFIGSGGTAIDSLERLATLLPLEELEVRGHSICLATMLAIRSGVNAVKTRSPGSCRIFVVEELDSRHRAFSPEAGIFESEEERLEAEKLCRTIGEQLEPKHPMGYEDCQSLVTFTHRCPNNTLPIFWKTGRSFRGREWMPLFPR